MNTGSYTLKTFLTDHNLEQLVIPEIQRDYVWETEHTIKLLKSIETDFKKRDMEVLSEEEAVDNLSDYLKDILLQALRDRKGGSHIGFIYAYQHREYPGRYILIDGQQRMTTLYLTLLCIYRQCGLQEVFRRNYFKDGVLRLDYKVRQSAHTFLTRFVDYILQDGAVDQTKNQYWYYSDYNHDRTIQSVLQNFQAIERFLAESDLDIDYIENAVQFLYFDTNNTEQGEELYLYMNSRGVSVSNNENIKAILLSGLSDIEKADWGKRWEHWQAIFWKHKGKERKTADPGFDEFLKWNKIISYAISNHDLSPRSMHPTVKQIKESVKIDIDGINRTDLNKRMSALEILLGNSVIFSASWLAINPSATDYIRLIPILYYLAHFDGVELRNTERLNHFINNAIRIGSVSKTPFTGTIVAIRMVHEMVLAGAQDPVYLRTFKEHDDIKAYVTEEEFSKFLIYHNQGNDDERIAIENVIWRAEINKYLKGSIQLICRMADISLEEVDLVDFELSTFEYALTVFEEMFVKTDDLLRRALLTKGDYSWQDGNTPALDGERWSFFNTEKEWQDAIQDNVRAAYILSLLRDYEASRETYPELGREDILRKIIADHLATEEGQVNHWRNKIISNAKILSYCSAKMICFSSADDIYPLANKTAHYGYYKTLAEF